MASLPNTKLVTYEEWLETPKDKNEEVVNGEVRIRPVGRVNDARIVASLTAGLLTQVDTAKFDVLTGSFAIVIRLIPLSCRTPDIAVFDRAAFVEVDGYFRSAPDLAVEVLSPRNTPRDVRQKIADYASLGLPELWVFSQDDRTVEVLLLEDGRLRQNAILSQGVLKPTRFPHVQIDIASIWPD
jgi:Uma2 family endonuclease